MASRAGAGKREREKLKESKRQEKQKRREKNQSGGTSSFDDMIAYVDEFGVLHSTPPDTTHREEIDASTIEVSTPKQTETEVVRPTGCVDYFDSAKGYGFIIDSQSKEKYFFHISSAPANIAQGNVVTFITEKSNRGLNAIDIEITTK